MSSLTLAVGLVAVAVVCGLSGRLIQGALRERRRDAQVLGLLATFGPVMERAHTEPRALLTWHPIALAASTLWLPPTTPTTSHPATLASCTKLVPTPPAAEWINILAPGLGWASSNSANQAVIITAGKAAASSNDRPSGRPKTKSSWTTK